MDADDWVVSLPPINLHTVTPVYLLTYTPKPEMTDDQARAWAKVVDEALWEAWRHSHILSIVSSRRRMN